ncbi:magnesium transporter CorA family protein [Candidatus Oscillochloris fontis]|uniref:magnesium transporter CorA family protein n=1 Tax=Candidatus Oscillochloris fontis TaxID=2496868 RepID=UPI00101DBC2C|nr:magnesium transporter CorA family protein [Candidatus Oscillochloris fontis]
MRKTLIPHSAPPPTVLSGPVSIQNCFTEGGLTWVDVAYPTRDDVLSIAGHYQFHPLHTEDVLSKLQRPKIDENEEAQYVFLVLHFPVFHAIDRLSIASEVDIFAGRDYVVTFHDGQLRPMRRIAQTADDERGRQLLMGRSSGFLIYRQIESMINYCFPMLYRLDEKLNALEESIFKRDVQSTVEELSYLRRDIIALRRILKPNIPVIRYLAARELDYLRLDEDAYFGDLTDGMTRLWDMLEEQKEIIEGLDATLSSLTSHRINQEMKIFTLISVIMLPMTLVASILGMNVAIPYAEHPLALPVTIAVMVVIAGGLYLFFRLKRMI